jgi:hypothetical protein
LFYDLVDAGLTPNPNASLCDGSLHVCVLYVEGGNDGSDRYLTEHAPRKKGVYVLPSIRKFALLLIKSCRTEYIDQFWWISSSS